MNKKRELILAYTEDHPDASHQEVADALASQGYSVEMRDVAKVVAQAAPDSAPTPAQHHAMRSWLADPSNAKFLSPYFLVMFADLCREMDRAGARLETAAYIAEERIAEQRGDEDE